MLQFYPIQNRISFFQCSNSKTIVIYLLTLFYKNLNHIDQKLIINFIDKEIKLTLINELINILHRKVYKDINFPETLKLQNRLSFCAFIEVNMAVT